MNETWKKAFDQIHAEPELKEHTRAYLKEKVYRTSARHASHIRRLAAASVFCLFLCAAGVCYLFFAPVTYISVDINPSLELGLNCFRRIISVEGYNDDGASLADSLDLKYLDYMDALDRILKSDTIETLLAGDNVLSLTVAGESETQNQEVLQDMETSVSGYSNVHCHSGDMEEVHEAHSCGMSFGKYQAFLILQELDPSVTSEDVQDLSMHEIWSRIRQLSGDSSDSSDTGGTEDTSGIPENSGSDDCSDIPEDSGSDDCSDVPEDSDDNCSFSDSLTGNGAGNGTGNSGSDTSENSTGNPDTDGSGAGNSGGGNSGSGHHHGEHHE
ncbi:MAG TPA: hypothetical protein H9734_10410 [Candidatus Fusicatenibacter merdavium]|uniref:Anti-sigma factor RsgI-like middle domain-containing protein n=1 Tax=Candidatus Fusicatenibacter merdavium TaxID=2838600 RepID=A0A9D1XF84_9FIRM|nr:hypothetical protein [Candidatus Fusicatenibacter merdavium]